MFALAAECKVNGQDARLTPRPDDARESGRKSGGIGKLRWLRYYWITMLTSSLGILDSGSVIDFVSDSS
jgi:hypothetical protein